MSVFLKAFLQLYEPEPVAWGCTFTAGILCERTSWDSEGLQPCSFCNRPPLSASPPPDLPLFLQTSSTPPDLLYTSPFSSRPPLHPQTFSTPLDLLYTSRPPLHLQTCSTPPPFLLDLLYTPRPALHLQTSFTPPLHPLYLLTSSPPPLFLQTSSTPPCLPQSEIPIKSHTTCLSAIKTTISTTITTAAAFTEYYCKQLHLNQITDYLIQREILYFLLQNLNLRTSITLQINSFADDSVEENLKLCYKLNTNSKYLKSLKWVICKENELSAIFIIVEIIFMQKI